VRKLDESGIAVHNLQLREPSLDDVFARATGYRLEGADAAANGDARPGRHMTPAQ
jgi:ABC-2 type transport system ATP-binding protein